MKLAYHRLAAKGLMLLGGLMLTPIYARQVTNATDTCAAVEECSNLEGDCCPSQNGFDLFCCNANEGSCLSNSGCLEANLTGECCPTIDNVFLDCCDRPFASCDAHPKCDHLAGDCCPTTSGVFLDCCLDDQSLDNITFPPNEAAAQCANNEQCVGLADACCPTIDGVYLYCCGEQPRSSGYQVLSTLVSPSVPEPFQLAYLVSSSPYVIGSSAPTGGTPPGPTSVIYERNSTELFDLVYYRANNTGVIGSASDFVSGSKKFYMHIWTDAPACTQILLQLDNLPLATPDNFPIGRHSRYISFTTKEQEWERIEFDFLDLLDEQLAADQINALALFFDPGSTNSYTYYFDFLDITEDGCVDSVDCEVPSIKNCPAYFGGEDEDDGPISNVGPPTSASPSSQPSASPSSHVPSASPSSSPSSNMPSLSPSSSPSTSAPSSLPSSFPSTEFPSTLPSLDPSAHPSELRMCKLSLSVVVLLIFSDILHPFLFASLHYAKFASFGIAYV